MLRVSVAACCAALCLIPAVAGAATTKGGAEHEVAPEGGALDLAGVSFGQHLRELKVNFRTVDPITPQLLGDSKDGSICAVLTQVRRAPRAICVTRRGGDWQIRSRGKRVAGTVTQPRVRELRLRFEPAAAGLRTGSSDWYVESHAAGCTTAPPAAKKISWSGAAIVSTSVISVSCEHRAPRVGSYSGRVWKTKLTGCKRHGAAQVSRASASKRIALTYDDGPSTYTAGFVRELDKLNVPATFFMVGQQISSNAALVRRVLASGNMIGDHSWNHADLGRGGAGASAQMRDTNAVIRRVTGFTPCLFRPPYGSTGSDLVNRSRALGMTSVLWSVDPLDWRTPGTASIVNTIVGQTRGGGIILSHDGGGPRSQTLAAMPQIVKKLKSRGYKFVTLTDLFGYSEKISLVK